MKLSWVTVIGAIGIALGIVGAGHATSVTFSGEDLNSDENVPLTSHPNTDNARDAFFSFLTVPIAQGTEDFEGFADGNGTGGSLDITFPGTGTATLTDNSFFGGVKELSPGTTNIGRFPISGTKYWESGALEDFTIRFSDVMAAFGFYGTDIGDPTLATQLTMTLKDTNGNITALENIPHAFPPANQGGSVVYFGIIDTDNPFIEVTFSNPGGFTDSFGFDNFTIATPAQVVKAVQPAPEPNTFLLLGSALIVGGLLMQRQRRTRR